MTSQKDDNGTSSQVERVLELKDCEMRVGWYGKVAEKDQFMTINLVFDFPDMPTSKIVGE